MPEQVIEQFDAWNIKNASIQFKKGGVQQTGTKFGCVGSLSVEPETTMLTKRCGRAVQKEKAVTTKLNVTVSAHIEVAVLRDIFGLSNAELKDGVYSYGANSIGSDFVFTADVVDDFEELTKLIAFPNASSATGMTLNIDTSQEELAMVELTFSAAADVKNQFYYEAITAELEDEEIAEQWHTQFNRALVEQVPTP
ncbi:phage tail protein [Metasolibacillus meyeri]|uniref:phage tail protein n=1 Tax=Metasolibacillus meyeri TaxID=1071052 RepID=UPI000D3020DE|nr:phage tail protein [Metasolibacillus meyeri]